MIQARHSPAPPRSAARMIGPILLLGFAGAGSGPLLAGCRAPPLVTTPGRRAEASDAPNAPTISSNILRKDYAGSAACAPCHADITALWEKSPMHRMTRLPESAEIRAPFDGREFRFKDDVARFEQVGEARFVRLLSAARGQHVYRVTKVIGGRYREDFAGVEVASTDPAAPVIGDPHAELILPASYVFQTASFRLKGYSVMVGTRPGMRAGGVWNETCIFCHNTIPYFDDLWGALAGPGGPRYQGEVVDRVLPEARRMRYAVTDRAGLTRALDEEVAVLETGSGAVSGAPLASGAVMPWGAALSSAAAVTSAGAGPAVSDPVRAALHQAMEAARSRFEPRHFVEIGIGCEACHGGSREHVAHPSRHPTFEPRAAFLTVSPPRGPHGASTISGAEWQNRACARCHQVLFSRYPQTWEGGSRRKPGEAGGSHISSGEARDFLLGGCAGAMPCTTCHDPHGEDSREHLRRLATPAANGVCTGCHQTLAPPDALRAHAHHDPAGAGGSCVACHMPRKNMGLGYALTRYHRIGSPTDANRIERDRPIECALCHAEKSVGSLLDDIARLWGKRYDTGALARLYGTLEANVLIATIERGYAHEQATAIGAAGEQRFQPAAAAIARAIDGNPYPLVGIYARAARAALSGRSGISDFDGVPTVSSGSSRLNPAPAPNDADDED